MAGNRIVVRLLLASVLAASVVTAGPPRVERETMAADQGDNLGEAPSPEANGGKAQRVLATFNTAYGVDVPVIGPVNGVRGVSGDELAWQIKSVVGRLRANARLMITVHGLVFKDEPGVPEDLRG